MKNYKKIYDDLENEVISKLKAKVKNSPLVSNFVAEPCISVNLFDYSELTIINDNLTFLDQDGYQYSMYDEANLTDLIDVLQSKPNKNEKQSKSSKTFGK